MFTLGYARDLPLSAADKSESAAARWGPSKAQMYTVLRAAPGSGVRLCRPRVEGEISCNFTRVLPR